MLQWLKDLMQGVTCLRIDYDNGGYVNATKNIAVVRYNTGDMVWFQLVDDEWRVTKIDTHDDSVQWKLT